MADGRVDCDRPRTPTGHTSRERNNINELTCRRTARRQDADDHGTNEFVLLDKNGDDTVTSIIDMTADGVGYVVYVGDEEFGSADTIAEAKQIVADFLAG
jgi:hypothetical protein